VTTLLSGSRAAIAAAGLRFLISCTLEEQRSVLQVVDFEQHRPR
jgi:hypothetical protein